MGKDFFSVNKGLNLTPRTTVPSNPQNGDMYYSATLNEFQLYENGQWITPGAGSGGGTGINYIAQTATITSNFEFNAATGWSTYLNSAGSGAIPDVTPTGTPSVNFTLTTTATNPLRGTFSGLITKDSANRQGHGVRTLAFPIDSVDINKTLYINLDFRTSVNFAVGDVQVFVSDGTNILTTSQPSIGGNTGTYIASFTSTSSLNYQLILHVASTNTAAWTFEYDTISVGPQNAAVVPAVSNWTTFPMVITATSVNPTKGSATVDFALWRRVGDSMEIRYNYVQSSSGTAGSGLYLFGLPTGVSMDTTKISTTVGPRICGSCSIGNASNNEVGIVTPNDATHLRLSSYQASVDGTPGLSDASPFNLSNAGAGYAFTATVPIANWSTGVQIANTSSEYGSNSSTTNTTDLTSFVNGPAGSLIPTITATVSNGTIVKNVQFQSPVQSTDLLVLEIQQGGVGAWTPVDTSGDQYTSFSSQGTTFFGMSLTPSTTSTFQCGVNFSLGGRTPSTTTGTFAAAGNSYPAQAGDRWRLRKTAGAALVGIVPDQIGQQMSSIGANAVGSTMTTITGDKTFSGNITFTGDMIPTGISDTSANKILATADAASTSYSPSISVNAGTIVSPLASGSYYKIGKWVHVSAEGSWTPGVTGTATQFFISLPVNIATLGGQHAYCIVQVTNTPTNLGGSSNFLVGQIDTTLSGSQLVCNFANKLIGTITGFSHGDSPQFAFTVAYLAG